MIRWTLIAALSLAGCVDDVGEGKTKAAVEDVPTEQTLAAPTGDTLKLPVDVAQSKLGALGAKITATHPIEFPTYTANIELAGDKVVGITYEADIASLTTDHPKLQTHLLAEDFLFAEKHPKATFKSVKVTEGNGAEGMTHTVVGDLTIRGKTMRVTFPAKVEVAAEAVRASTEFVIDRQDFGVTYPGKADDLVQDNVVMKIEFVAPRA